MDATRDPATGAAPLPVVATVLALAGIRDGEVVVDVGCATGLLTHPAAAAGGPLGRVFGVDVDPALLAAARDRRASRIGWLRAAPDRLPFASGAVDKVLAGAAFGTPSPFAECARVLRPYGRLVVAVPPGTADLADRLRDAGLDVTYSGEDEHARYVTATPRRT
jgi:SAM-dependent methyltransferase